MLMSMEGFSQSHVLVSNKEKDTLGVVSNEGISFPESWKKAGDTVSIIGPDGAVAVVCRIDRVESGRAFARERGLNLTRDIPIYFLDRPFKRGISGAYSEEGDRIYLLTARISDERTIRHEIVHAIEKKQEISEELLAYFERVKALYPEGIEHNGGAIFNFKKDVHEFLADGYTQQILIDELKKKGLYEEFLRVSEYLKILYVKDGNV